MKKVLLPILALVLAIGLALSMAMPAVANPAPGLVGLWHFDEGSGDTAYDSSGFGNDGRLGSLVGSDANDPTWVLGKFGNALSFDGSADYVNAGSDESFDFTDKFTVEAWINGSEFQSYYDLIVFRGYSNWAFGYFRAGMLMFGETAWNSLWSRHIYSDTLSWTLNQWYHIAVVYDTVGKTADFYRDGVPVGVGKESTDKFGITNSGDVTIGYPHSVSFNGIIDEVRVWDKALTASQIALSYSGSVTWLPPVTNADFTLQEGTTLPLKFQLYDNGNLVTSQQDVSLEITKNGSTILTFGLGDGIDNLRWNDDEDHYIANLKAKDWTEGTYRATVFWDGVVINETITFYISPSKGAGRGNSGK